MSDDNKKPWEDGEFDAEKAWSLIQNLRTELTDTKSKVATERQARTAAESQIGDVDGKIKAAEDRAVKAERELFTARAIAKYPSLSGNEDLLTGENEEAVMKIAERLASLNVPKKDDTDEDTSGAGDAGGETPPADSQTPKLDASGRPIPALKPGHGGDDSTPIDPVAIAKAARNRI